MSDLELRLGRIEGKLDGLIADVGEIRGAASANRRWLVVVSGFVSAIIGAISGHTFRH